MSDTASSPNGCDAATVLAEVRAQRDELLGFLEKLVLCESPSSDAAAQGPVLDLLEEGLDGAGFEVRRLPGKTSGGQMVAAPAGCDFDGVDLDTNGPAPGDGDEAARQLLLGHCDTVWAHGTLADMPLRIDDDVVRGPGVFDMKGGLAQTVFALRTLHRLGLEPSLVPLVLVNSDEELGSKESAPLIERLARQARRAYVMEPALGPQGRLKTARKGVGQFVVEVHGKAAHAGLDPEAGASAILEMSHQIQRLHALNDAEAGINVNVGIIGGGTRANVIAPHSRAVVDVRVPDMAAAASVTAAIRALVPVTQGVSLQVTGAVDRAPLERNDRNQALWHLARSLAGELGFAIEQGFAGGGSDGNLTSPLTATLDGLGAVGDGAHAAHEHIDVRRSLERCALLAMLLLAGDQRR